MLVARRDFRQSSGLGLAGFWSKLGNTVVNVGRVALVPVTGGASLLAPKSPFGGGGSSAPPPPPADSLAPPPPPPPPYPTAFAPPPPPPLPVYAQPPPPPPPSSQGVMAQQQAFYQAGALALPTPGSGTPPWLIPVAVGGGVLALAFIFTSRKKPS